MELKRIFVTPEMASQMLEKNSKNRNVMPSVVERYARDMEEEVWDETGESIKFNGHGDLVDGQHRLLACIKAGVGFRTFIAEGVSSEAIRNIDTNRPRSLADFLRIFHDVKDANLVAAAIALDWRFITYGSPIKTMKNVSPTSHEGLEWYKNNPRLKYLCSMAKRIGRATGMPASVAAVLLYRLSEEQEKNETFFENVVSGANLEFDDPHLVFRKWLMKTKNRNVTIGRPAPYVYMAMAIKAWNAFIEGRKIKRLTWSRGGDQREPFPKISMW